jgi:hypothetical protein
MDTEKKEEKTTEESKMSFYDKNVLLKPHSEGKTADSKIEDKSYSEIEDEDEIDQTNLDNIFPVEQITHGCTVFSDMIISAAHTIQDTLHDALVEDGDVPSTPVVVPNSSSSSSVPADHNLTVWETVQEVASFMWETSKEAVVIAEDNLEKVSESVGPSIHNVSLHSHFSCFSSIHSLFFVPFFIQFSCRMWSLKIFTFCRML